MIKKLSCVSHGSLKCFPHKFTQSVTLAYCFSSQDAFIKRLHFSNKTLRTVYFFYQSVYNLDIYLSKDPKSILL